jgi:hypothetical protein
LRGIVLAARGARTTKTMSIMNYADTLLDRRVFSTDTNEYATGLNDEN